VERANIQTSLVLNKIKRLGLTIEASKTDVVCFRGRQRTLRVPTLNIDGREIAAKSQMKYLGIILDERLSYRSHIVYLEEKVGKVTRVLHRITPNLRGPRKSRRRLYANVVLSVIRGPRLGRGRY